MVFSLLSLSFLHDMCLSLYFHFCGLDKLQCYFGLGLEAHANLSLWPFPVRLITIFDCKVVMKWEGTASDGTAVQGTLTIPEVSHEIICDRLSEFVVSISGAPMLLWPAMPI
jgi:hypothetical protein